MNVPTLRVASVMVRKKLAFTPLKLIKTHMKIKKLKERSAISQKRSEMSFLLKLLD